MNSFDNTITKKFDSIENKFKEENNFKSTFFFILFYFIFLENLKSKLIPNEMHKFTKNKILSTNEVT